MLPLSVPTAPAVFVELAIWLVVAEAAAVVAVTAGAPDGHRTPSKRKQMAKV